jgi:hypothetical protein
MSAESVQEAAEGIVRDAERRGARSPNAEGRQSGPETTSAYLGMVRKEAPAAAGERKVRAVGTDAPSPAGDPAPLSSALGIRPLAAETDSPAKDTDERRQAEGSHVDPRADERAGEIAPNKTHSDSSGDSDLYVSSELGLPLLSENPTPLSSALHIPTLITDSRS